MKRFILILYIAIFCAASVSAQQLFYAEDGEIRNLEVSRDNGEVKVAMDIDISEISLGSDETVILTPIVTDGQNKITMPSIELMGRRAYFYYKRDGAVPETENPFVAQRVAKRAEKKEGVKQVVNYEASFAFAEWMRGSTVAIREGLCGCGKLRGQRDVPVGNFGHNIYTPEYVWSFIQPDPEPIKVRNESHTAYINFWVDRYEILENYKNNAVELAGIIESISKVDDDEDLTITSITIEGWASPEATEQHNKVLSQNRANSLANYVSRKTGVERKLIEAIGCGEDWAGLRELVDATPGLLYRDKVYDIIDSDLTLDQKDWKLSQLKPSDIYTRLMNEMYPKLRRNDYVIIYEIRNFDLEEARRLINEHPKKLSVDEMYKVAGSYERGSREYNNVLETAVRLYPEVVAAAVNAADLALKEGDVDYALEILERSNQADARIQAAEGYIYILKGDYDKALDLLRKAAKEGNEDAQHNLAELERYLASI